MAHLVRTRWGIDALLLHGHVDGWMPSFALGYQEFLLYGPGFTWMVALIRLLSFGLLSNAGAMKVLTIGSFVTFPLAVVFLARSYGLSRRAAGLAAPLSLLVSNPFGIGLSAIFQVGLIAQQVGGIFACLSLGSLLRVVAEPRRRWTLLAACSSAALLVTHLISVVIVALLFAVSVPTVLVTDKPRRRAATQLAWVAIGTTGLAAFWLMPFLLLHHLRGPATTWGTPLLSSRLKDIFGGRYVLRPGIAIVIACAAFAGMARVLRKRRWALALVVAPVGYVAVARLALDRNPGNDIAIHLENRGMGYVVTIAMFSLAAALAWVTARHGRQGDVVAVAVASGLVLFTAGPWRHIAREQPLGTPQLHSAAEVLKVVVPTGARYAEVRQFPADASNGGVPHPDFWLAAQSARPTLNEFNVESSATPEAAFVPEHLLDRSAAEGADVLARLGVTHVVATTEEARAHLLFSSQFAEVWREPPFSVLAVRAAAGQPDPASLVSGPKGAPALTARLLSVGTNRYSLQIDASVATEVTVAVAWSPRWHAAVNGKSAELGHTSDGLLRLTAGRGRSEVELRFQNDYAGVIGLIVTGVTLALGTHWIWRTRRRTTLAHAPSQTPGDVGGGPAGRVTT